MKQIKTNNKNSDSKKKKENEIMVENQTDVCLKCKQFLFHLFDWSKPASATGSVLLKGDSRTSTDLSSLDPCDSGVVLFSVSYFSLPLLLLC